MLQSRQSKESRSAKGKACIKRRAMIRNGIIALSFTYNWDYLPGTLFAGYIICRVHYLPGAYSKVMERVSIWVKSALSTITGEMPVVSPSGVRASSGTCVTHSL